MKQHFFSINKMFVEYVITRKSKHDKRNVPKNKHVIQHIFFYEIVEYRNQL
jgi:hypothetical protein